MNVVVRSFWHRLACGHKALRWEKQLEGQNRRLPQYAVIHPDVLGRPLFISKIGALPLSGDEEGAEGQ